MCVSFRCFQKHGVCPPVRLLFSRWSCLISLTTLSTPPAVEDLARSEIFMQNHLCVCVRVCACACACACVCACACACVRVRVRVCVRARVCVHARVCVRACVRACVCVCVHACMCVCVCTYNLFSFVCS